jgi:hypothetical protein
MTNELFGTVTVDSEDYINFMDVNNVTSRYISGFYRKTTIKDWPEEFRKRHILRLPASDIRDTSFIFIAGLGHHFEVSRILNHFSDRVSLLGKQNAYNEIMRSLKPSVEASATIIAYFVTGRCLQITSIPNY